MSCVNRMPTVCCILPSHLQRSEKGDVDSCSLLHFVTKDKRILLQKMPIEKNRVVLFRLASLLLG